MFIAIFSASVLGYFVGYYTHKYIIKTSKEARENTVYAVETYLKGSWILEKDFPLPEKIDERVWAWDGEYVDTVSTWAVPTYNKQGQRLNGYSNKPIIAWMKIPKGPAA